MTVKFTVKGEPRGKGRPRFTAGGGHPHAITPEQTVIYENLIRLEYQDQCGGVRFEDGHPLTMMVNVYHEIPKSASKKKKAEMLSGSVRPTKKPDSSNILKAIEDALNGIAYRDDSQIVETCIYRYYDETPRVEVEIYECTDVEHLNIHITPASAHSKS